MNTSTNLQYPWKKISSNRWIPKIGSYLLIATGTFTVSVAFSIFFNGNHVLVSGIGGVAMLLSYLFHLSLGVIYFIINIPLFLSGWRYVGFSFFLKSIWGTTTLSLFLFLTSHLPTYHQFVIAPLLGALISGIAVGTVLLAGGTTGGTDIISVVLNQRSGWSIGRIMFVLNTVIVLAGAALFGFERALLTIVSVFVTSTFVNVTLKVGGWDRTKQQSRSHG